MRVFVLLIASLFSLTVFADEDWTPPENPNPTVILRQASADTSAGKFKSALAKHVWYHENALKFDEAQHGVRLSFALGYWHDLAKRYPPAMEKLKSTRDEAREKVIQSDDIFLAFSDFSSINRTLGDEAKTFELYKSLSTDNPEKASKIFGMAKPSIIRAKAYDVYLKHVDPKKEFESMVQSYEMGKKSGFGALPGEKLSFFEKKFANDAAILVAILIKGEKQAEAQSIAVAAKQKLSDTDFHQALADALDGVVPEPWP